MRRATGSDFLRRRPFAGVALAVAAVAFSARPAVAQDQAARDLKVAQTLLDHGVFEGAISVAEAYTDKSDDARVIRACGLCLKAAAEKDPKAKKEAQAEADKAVAECKGSKRAKEIEAFQKGQNQLKFSLEPAAELDLAWSLKDHGHLPWAEALLDAAIAGKVFSGENLVTARTMRGQFYGDRSSLIKNQDAAKRKEAIDKAKETLLDIAKGTGGPKPSQIVDAKCTFYDVLYKRGTNIFEASKHTDDLAAAEAMKKEALDAFKEAVSFLETESKQLEDEMNKQTQPGAGDPPPEPPKEGEPEKKSDKSLAERCLIFAKYYWPKCVVGQAKCVADRAEHDTLVKKAIDLYSDYNLMFNDPQNPNMQAFEAAIDMADACREIQDDQGALVALESALSIEKQSPDGDPLHPETMKRPLGLEDDQLDVFARASLVKAKALMAKGDYAGALKTLNRVFDNAKEGIPVSDSNGRVTSHKPHTPSFEDTNMGKSLKIERAEALARTGKKNDALKDLDKLIKEDPTGPIGLAAAAKSSKIKGGGGGEEVEGGQTTAMALDKASKALDDSPPDYGAVATNARLALRLARVEGNVAKTNPKAYMLLAKAYRAMGRYYEAAVAFEVVANAQPENAPEDIRSDAALQRVGCFGKTKMLLEKGNAFDRDHYESALKDLTNKFRGKGVASYLLGEQLREEQKWDEAANAYEKVEEDAGPLFDKALCSGPMCRYNAANQLVHEKKDAKAAFEAAVTSLKRSLDIYKKDEATGDDARKAERKNLDAQVRFILADLLLKADVNKPEDVLKIFEKADEAYAANPENLARAGIFRILAFLKLGQSDKAEGQLETLLKDEKFRGLKRTLLAAKDVGGALDKESSKKETAPEDRKKMRKRAGQYYARWILDGLDPKSELKPSVIEMKYVANRLFVFALDVVGLPEDDIFGEVPETFDPGEGKQLFTDACAIFGALAKLGPDQADQIKKDKWLILANWGETAGFVKDWAQCRDGLEGMVKETNLIDSQGQIDFKVVSAKKELLGYYHDLGRAYVELGAQNKEDSSAAFKKAFAVFDNVLNTAAEKTPTWWKAKLNYYHAMEKRGTEPDYKELGVAVQGLARKYPDFKDAGALASAFTELKNRLIERKVLKPDK